MKKQIILLCSAYCVAVYCAVRLPVITIELLCLFSVLLLGIVFWKFKSRRLWAILLTVSVLFGYAHASYRNRDANFVPTQFDARVVSIEGVVREVREGDGYRCYILRPEKLSAERSDREIVKQPKGDIALTVYKVDPDKAAYAYGDRILAKGTFALLDSPANTGEFDYKMWYKTDGVYGSVTTQELHTKLLGKAKMPMLENAVQQMRSYCITQIRTYIGDGEGGLLSAILLSERSDMPKELREDINRAGLSHMCVASGMHLSMVYGILLWIFTRLRLKKWFYYPICAVVLHIFAAMCGGVSMQRAIIMFDLCMISFYTGGDENRVYTCFWAGFLMLIFNPLYLFSAGFLLSFSCVFGILLFAEKIEKFLIRFLKWRPLCGMLATSLSAQVLVLPVLAVCFNQIPLYGLLYNMLVLWLLIPIMVLGAIFLLLSAVWTYGAGGVAFVLKYVLQGICALVGCVRHLPASTLNVARPSLMGLVVYYCVIGMVCMLYLRKKKYAELCMRVVLVCTLCATIMNFATQHYLRVDFINVGEGDATLMRSPAGVNVLIDGGGSPAYSNRNVGETTLLPYLHRVGVSEIDYAVVSHYERDHVQGVLYVCERMPVRRLILPKRHDGDTTPSRLALEACAKERNIEVHYMQGGDRLVLEDGIVLEALSPDRAMLERCLGENNHSLVLRVHYGDTKLLFTGDAEVLAEKQMLLNETDLSADVLKVAHHGAATSSAYLFLKRVNPSYSVISAGDYYITGHPAAQTVTTLKRLDTEIYNTFEDGNIRFYITRSGVRRIE